MTHEQAKKYLERATRRGYVACHSGIALQEEKNRWGGNIIGATWGINIDEDGHDGRAFE
jgi:hypothetical protein